MIRFKVFIPVVLILALIVFVAIYRIDSWLTRGIENAISAVTDTKTDITSLHLSFKNSSLTIKRLEIASSEDEFKNGVEFGDIIIDFQTLPLLRKRFVIDNFSIKDVAFGTKRAHSGKLPPRKKEPPSWISEKMGEAMASLNKEMSDLPILKLVDFEIPSNPAELLNSLQLQSVDVFKASISKTEQMKSQWATKIRGLGNFTEYEVRIQEARKLVQNPPQNPQEILNAAETIQKSYEFFQSERKRAESLLGDATTDMRKIQQDYDAARKALDADYERGKKLVSLDSLNVNNLSRMLFGPLWVERAETVLRYHALLRQYMASKSSKEDAVEVKKRAKGRDIIFVREKAQPSFVLAKSEFTANTISAGDRKAVQDKFGLKLKDLNSAPKLYGKPSEVELTAELKDSLIRSFLFKAFWDYTKDVAKDEFTLAVEDLKADTWPVGIPKLFPVKLGSGLANTSTKLKFDGDQMRWTSQIAFRDVAWDFSEIPSGGIIYQAIREVISNIKNFRLDLELRSTPKGLDFDVKSDIDEPIRAGVNAMFQKKLVELEEKIKREIDLRVSAYRDQATAQLKEYQVEVQKHVESFVQKATSYQDEAKRMEDSLRKKAQDAVQNKAKEQIQKVVPNLPNPLKGIKSPF